MFDKEIVMLIGEALLAGGYLLWLLTGVVNAAINTKTWSWKKMATDLAKAALMGVVMVALVALSDGLDWYATSLGYDISVFTDGASTTMMFGGIVAGIAIYWGRAVRNAMNFFKLPTDVKQIEGANPDYSKMVEEAKSFIETITPKSIKEMWEEEGVDKELLEGEVLYEEGGKGASNNTYPEPYRSAPQDSMTDPSTCYNRECVSYTAWKIKELVGSWPKRTGGMNAKYWVQRLAENGYTHVVATPVNGGKYVGVSEAGTYGHVVWFEEGNTISEYNYTTRGAFSIRTINLSAYKWVEIQAPVTNTKKSNAEVADEVIAGKWGNGEDRKMRLTAAGYNYNEVQAIVNAKCPPTSTPPAAPKKSQIVIGSVVKPKTNVDYTGRAVRQYDATYTVTSLTGGRAVLSARGAVWCAMKVSNLELV